MNKKDYIREVDELHAPDSLKNKISEMKPTRSANLKRNKRITAIIAACLAVAVLIGGAYGAGTSLSKDKAPDETINENSYSCNDSNVSSDMNGSINSYGTPNGVSTSVQKLIKTASVRLETKNADELIKKSILKSVLSRAIPNRFHKVSMMNICRLKQMSVSRPKSLTNFLIFLKNPERSHQRMLKRRM